MTVIIMVAMTGEADSAMMVLSDFPSLPTCTRTGNGKQQPSYHIYGTDAQKFYSGSPLTLARWQR